MVTTRASASAAAASAASASAHPPVASGAAAASAFAAAAAVNRKAGLAIVARAIDNGLVPEFKKGLGHEAQTVKTKWALHMLAVMSRDGPVDISDVKEAIKESQDLLFPDSK
jgi:hypothetical protein